MTAQQLDAVKALARRFDSDLSHTNVMHDPHGLPEGWVQAAVHKKGTKPEQESLETLKILAGVGPDGAVHS